MGSHRQARSLRCFQLLQHQVGFAHGARLVLGHNLLVYGVGGLIVPFVGIKMIDVLVNLLPVWN